MKVKAVIFDFDEVIIDSYQDHLYAFAIAAKEFGIRLDKKKLYKRFGKSGKDIMRELVPSLAEKEIKAFMDIKERIYQHLAAKKGMSLMPAVRQTLDFLSRKKIKLAISSSAIRKNILLAANHTGIKKYFSAIVAAEDVRHHKPDPEPLLKAAKLLKVKPGECIYIGDSIFEMIAAKRAKMLAVGIHTGIYSVSQLKRNGASVVIKKTSELQNIVS